MVLVFSQASLAMVSPGKHPLLVLLIPFIVSSVSPFSFAFVSPYQFYPHPMYPNGCFPSVYLIWLFQIILHFQSFFLTIYSLFLTNVNQFFNCLSHLLPSSSAPRAFLSPHWPWMSPIILLPSMDHYDVQFRILQTFWTPSSEFLH